MEVKLLRKKKKAALVEYYNGEMPIRVSVPSSKVSVIEGTKAEVPEQVIDEGIPYGIPWASLIKKDFVVTGEMLEQSFHKAGIWTWSDFNSNRQGLTGVVMTAAQEIVATVSKIIKEYSNKEV